jgi:hypothetical protein
MQEPVDDDMDCSGVLDAGVCDDEYFCAAQDSREGQHSGRKCRDAKVASITGDWPEVLAAVAKRWVRVADGRESTDTLVELVVLVESVALAPEGFPYVLITIAASVQSLM